VKKNFTNMTLKELEIFFENIGEKKFRAKQVFKWMYSGVSSFEEMTDLSKQLREKLDQVAEIGSLKMVKVLSSETDYTKKYLFELSDGNSIETVFMKYKFGNSICISSQAGCRMGCSFCASGIGGLSRNLTGGEMIGQILAVEKHVEEKITNIVVMGTGEPFDNYHNLSQFIELVNSKDGLNVGMRNITVSTCGVVPMIGQFGRDFPQVNLAISLHAPNDEIRKKIMPINNSYPMDVLLNACRIHVEKTGRRITFEYALMKGINDSMTHSDQLSDKLRGTLCHVNLITLNKVEETGLKGTDRETAEKFKAQLEKRGIPTTIRRELGTDISAACGQLRLS